MLLQARENQAIRQYSRLPLLKLISMVTQGKFTTFHLTQHLRTRTFEIIILVVIFTIFCVDTTSWIVELNQVTVSKNKSPSSLPYSPKGADRGEAYQTIIPDPGIFSCFCCEFIPGSIVGGG